MIAIWNNKIIAESNETVVVENNHYFPVNSINNKYFENSDMHSICPWKGEASYYSLIVDGKTNKDAAWFYPNPKEKAEQIKNHVAFWKGVKVVSD
ncbi:MAG: DUF427 domain-containing protein [Melioribacteraceae bacterium]|nr:DUF427 domain-containing protein [Melioribacteraceae bacterium]